MVCGVESVKEAIRWALEELKGTQFVEHDLVDKVREYFNTNNINYDTCSYGDLVPYPPE